MSQGRTRGAAAGLIAGLALWLLAAPVAGAHTGAPAGPYPGLLTSSHFAVHYAAPTSAAQAQQLASNAEKAWAAEVDSWGFPRPVPDGTDGGGSDLVDVYVSDVSPSLGEAHRDDFSADTTTGFIVVDSDSVGDDQALAHELFHLIQYAIYAKGPKFIKEGTAEWAGANVAQRTGWLVTYWRDPSQPLECSPSSPCGSPNDLSYSRWMFYEYLSEHYGSGIVKEILERELALSVGTDTGLGLQAVDDVLAAHGSSLAQAFSGFTGANAGAAYTFPGLADSGLHPSASLTTRTGASTAQLPAQSTSVNHLAAGYMYFYGGTSQVAPPSCNAATLHITVDLPPGVASQPTFADDNGLHPLNVSGNTADVSVPWTDCPYQFGVLGLPNGSRSADGAQFLVHSALAVTPAATATSAPRIKLSRLSVSGRQLRFAVSSSRRGTLGVLLRSRYVRGSFKLRKGKNSLKMRLPARFRGIRQLVATPYSTTGQRGRVIKRRLTIAFSAEAKGRPSRHAL
jgi:hypothetical protein